MRAAPMFAFGFLACAAEEPPTDTNPPTEAPPACATDTRVTHAEGGCFGAPDTWEFKGDLQGCAESAELYAWRTDGDAADELHPMELSGEGPDRVWQAWFLSLADGAPADSWVAGTSSSFECDTDTGKLTFAVRMLDAEGEALSCATWGHAPADVASGAVLAESGASLVDCVVQTGW